MVRHVGRQWWRSVRTLEPEDEEVENPGRSRPGGVGHDDLAAWRAIPVYTRAFRVLEPSWDQCFGRRIKRIMLSMDRLFKQKA